MRQMIKNIYMLLFGVFTILACNSRHEIAFVPNKVEKEAIQNANSIVHSEWLANTIDRKCREYFIVENGDTSAYTFVVRNFTYSNEFIIDIDNQKFKFHEVREREYKIKNIEGIMNELDSCLSVISLDYQIDSLKFLSFALADMGDVMLEFNNELDKDRRPGEYYYHHPELLHTALCATSLNSRVESIMKKHGLNIVETKIAGGLACSKEYFLEENIIRDSSKVSEPLTSAYVRYRLEPLQ